MGKLIKRATFILIPLLLLPLQFAFPIETYLPHEKVVLGMPFEPTDPPTRIVPMGETVNHPKPQSPLGHPGIDFQWNHAAKLLAAASGKVTEVSVHEGGTQGWDVVIRSGVYFIRYKELGDYNNWKVGQKINRGDLVGYPHKNVAPDGSVGYQLHWEFASVNYLIDRICPDTYWDPEVKKFIDDLWERVGYTYEGQFPHLCSGDYAGKLE